MVWETLKNRGYILEKNCLNTGPNVIKTRDFLNKTTKAFTSYCIKYYDMTKEHPFAHRERQVDSMLMPSLCNVADAVFKEQFIERKLSKDSSSHGWVDYWVLYRKTTFLIELKHPFCSANSTVVRKTTRESYKEAVKQIKSISPEEALNLSFFGKNLVKIALVVVPFYAGSKIKKSLTAFDKEDAEEVFDKLVSGLTPKPDWSCLWLLHDRLQKPVEYENCYELYPCVGIVAKVDNSLSLK